ncbi:MAG: alpha/beta hydrolase fold domain-containing protein [Acidimicrobiales bacterium]
MSSEPFYDPEIRAALERGPRMGTVSARVLDKIRADRLLENAQVPLSDNVTRTDIMVPGPDGAPEVRLRVHRRKGLEGDAPCLFWIHGGGYVLGAPEQDDLRFDRWCQRFDVVGVAVQYRLAPEHPYPAPVEDCYAGLRWVKEHGAEIGVDTARVGIGGPSGGGGLAAALGLLVRDRKQFDIDYQLLIYPMIDDTRTSVTANWDVPVWDPKSNEFGWSSYLGPLSLGRRAVPCRPLALHRPVGPAAHVHHGGHARRLRRRGHRLRTAPQPVRRVGGAARVPGRSPRLRGLRAEHRGGQAGPARHQQLAGRPPGVSGLSGGAGSTGEGLHTVAHGPLAHAGGQFLGSSRNGVSAAGPGSLGRPRPRSPITLRCTWSLPA